MIALFRRLLALFCATALVASQSATLAHAMAENPYEGEYIADVAEFSTVTVLSKEGYGSGFFIDNRLFVTNHHVVEGGEGAVRFYTQIPSEGWEAAWTAGVGVIVAVDRQNDLALVLTEKSYDYPLKVEKTSVQPKDTNVVIVGSPRGRAATISEGLYLGKKITSFNDDSRMIRRGIELFSLGLPGSSGGPVLIKNPSTKMFSVIGVYSASTSSDNSGFAFPSEKIWEIYNQNKGKINRLKSFNFSKTNTALSQRTQNLSKGSKFFRALELYEAKKYRKSYGLFEEAAEQGDKNAQFMLGYMYQKGRGVDQNYKNSAFWHTKAAEQGHRVSQVNLGEMYDKGQGVDQSAKKSAFWYAKAAEQGHAIAQNNLGYMYEYGKGVAQSYEKAVSLYAKAAEQGLTRAQTNLGVMYRRGQGIAQNYEKAVSLYAKAAEQGHAIAQNNLGYMYEYGKGVAQSYEKAVSLYAKAAEQGLTRAQTNLGVMYWRGQGIAQNYEKAVSLYAKAAEQGYAIAQNNLGYMYEYGKGVAQSYEKAVSLYAKAAEQGNAYAQYNLGGMYEYGRGVDQSYEKAVSLYAKAAKQGHKYAQKKKNCFRAHKGRLTRIRKCPK